VFWLILEFEVPCEHVRHEINNSRKNKVIIALEVLSFEETTFSIMDILCYMGENSGDL